MNKKKQNNSNFLLVLFLTFVVGIASFALLADHAKADPLAAGAKDSGEGAYRFTVPNVVSATKTEVIPVANYEYATIQFMGDNGATLTGSANGTLNILGSAWPNNATSATATFGSAYKTAVQISNDVTDSTASYVNYGIYHIKVKGLNYLVAEVTGNSATSEIVVSLD